jgi:hypothetical protein
MLGDWARFAGFFAIAMFALVGSLLWALNYPPQDAAWTCKTETEAHQPNHNRVRILSCRKTQPINLQEESEKADGSSANKANDDIKITDKLLVVLTGLLVSVGAFQAFYLWGTLKATANAANAAVQSAEAQIAVEGARLTCLPVSSSYWNEIGCWADRWPNSPEMPLRKTFAVIFALKNYGKTPATIVCVNARLVRSPEAPGNIYIESPFLDLPAEIVVGAALKSDGEFKVEFGQFFRLEEAIQVQNGGMNLWFNGRIVYHDVFDRVGTQVFLYKVRPRGGFTLIWDQTTYRQK